MNRAIENTGLFSHMNGAIEKSGFLLQAAASIRIVLVSMGVCCLFYCLLILGLGQTLTPYRADGSLIEDEKGVIIGSELLAQGFSRPEYLWPRPSAVEYNASATGGSNLSPTNPELRLRAEAIIAKSGVSGKEIPADLVTASGSGMDPHITLRAAMYQAERIASARGLTIPDVIGLFESSAQRPGGALTPEPIVNVLKVNLALDRLGK
jgi:K+-transporting ATPase ATPase C chain